MPAAEHFSQSYAEARRRFLEAARAAGATLGTREHPLKGPAGETLATDIARLGPAGATRILGIGSGTHGVEGYCGSGVQTALLSEGFARERPDDTAVVFIHAINPYGFAFDRRVNEDNVDLNRNFLDHTKPHPENPGYEELFDAINPPDISARALAESREKLKAYADKHGAGAMQHALSAGQYTHPNGVQFGGLEPVWSNRTLRAIIRDEMGRADRVIFVDIHSGLGARGAGEMICTDSEASGSFKRMREWWGGIVRSTVDGDSISSNVPGSIPVCFAEELKGREVTAGGLEFGTVPIREVTVALQADNWLHQNGGHRNPKAREVGKLIRDAFYVDADDWKDMVTAQTRDVCAAALRGLKG
ncbi:MAG: M14 family metallopeptidase [Parvibaculum sp.]|nr:M14 family metallopeptidase [Parvibaculum sp.]